MKRFSDILRGNLGITIIKDTVKNQNLPSIPPIVEEPSLEEESKPKEKDEQPKKGI
jgi:hypothetical protein